MIPPHVKKTLDVLAAYYADKEGNAHRLNPVQVTVYCDGLAKYDEATLQAAARQYMRAGTFFPKLSELLNIIAPPVDLKAAAAIAWGVVEKAIRQAGSYQGVTFEQGVIGECVRQVFGTWQRACAFEFDSPGWAIRRQSFMAVFPEVARHEHGPVTLNGLQGHGYPMLIGAVQGVPLPSLNPPPSDLPSRSEASNLLDKLRRDWQRKQIGDGGEQGAA